MSCWNAPTRDGRARLPRARDYRSPTECPTCGDSDLTFNGRDYWCNHCNEIADPIPVDNIEAYITAGLTFQIGAVDHWYEQETALYREPAAMNWPHGRLRTKTRPWNEGKPRTHEPWHYRRAYDSPLAHFDYQRVKL